MDCSYDRVPESALDELVVQLQGELDRTASALESSAYVIATHLPFWIAFNGADGALHRLSFMDAPRWPAPQASAPPPRPTQPPKYKMTREESISALWRVVCLAL